MIKRTKAHIPGELPTPEMLRGVLREHARNCARLQRLYAYYEGRHDVLRRERRKGLPNSRMPHGYPAYISDMAAGYLIGTPIRYEYDDPDALKALADALRESDTQSLDAEIAMQQSIFGRGVELIYADENARPRCTVLDPRDAFTVYSDDETASPLFGVYLRAEYDAAGRRTGQIVTV